MHITKQWLSISLRFLAMRKERHLSGKHENRKLGKKIECSQLNLILTNIIQYSVTKDDVKVHMT